MPFQTAKKTHESSWDSAFNKGADNEGLMLGTYETGTFIANENKLSTKIT